MLYADDTNAVFSDTDLKRYRGEVWERFDKFGAVFYCVLTSNIEKTKYNLQLVLALLPTTADSQITRYF